MLEDENIELNYVWQTPTEVNDHGKCLREAKSCARLKQLGFVWYAFLQSSYKPHIVYGGLQVDILTQVYQRKHATNIQSHKIKLISNIKHLNQIKP